MPGVDAPKMIVRLLYFLLLAYLVRLLFRSFYQRVAVSVASPMATEPAGGTEVYKGLMVRDPVCGVHLPESRALVEERKGERLHFCSEACRETFRKTA